VGQTGDHVSDFHPVGVHAGHARRDKQ
jgi:hypothetical protein